MRRSIEAAQEHAPEPTPPSWQSPPEQPDIAREPDDLPAPRGLSVYEQQALELGLGGPCWWEDSPEKRARDEARRRDRYQTM